MAIRLPARHNPTLQAVIERVNADEELFFLWRAQNVNAVDRLGMSDHGPVHMQVVSNIALRLIRILIDWGVEPGIVRDYGLSNDDAEVVVVLASLLHDVGMSIHREDHESFSLFVAQPKVKDLLEGLYDPAVRTVMTAEILHAIISHRSGGHPYTVEAGVIRVADALDMAKGRSRIPFETGSVNIHSLSAAAVADVVIEKGSVKPISIHIHMVNSAGIFQVDELLKKKLHGSGLEPYVEVSATIEGDAEKKLISGLKL
ncbi:MAG: HD domain-containing protein [Chloroflexi bacterium]|nr:HD domain-containing protein [Chloroflexota bacterium]